MPLTLFDSANKEIIVDSRKINEDSNGSHREIINDKFEAAYTTVTGTTGTDATSINKFDKILKQMHQKVTSGYADHAAHVSGYYYIQMINGTWADHAATLHGGKNDISNTASYDTTYASDNDTSRFTEKNYKLVATNFGQLATDIDIPQLNIEYESISGKARNLNYASRLHFAGDFSINFIENYTNHIFRYHESWFKYIDALKKGFITLNRKAINKESDKNYFIEVPYFNAVWVVIFAPFTSNIRGLIKIMGVAPINLPFKQIIGDRGKNALTTINQNYKSNDMVYKFFDEEVDKLESNLYHEFMNDMDKIHNK